MTTERLISGQVKMHRVRLEFDATAGRAAPRIDPKRYDATLCDEGEMGSISIRRGWMIYEGKSGQKEREMDPRIIKQLNDEAWLEDEIYSEITDIGMID